MRGCNVPVPIDTFQFSGIHSELVNTLINDMGFVNPTPIQQYSIPVMIGNRDMIACSQTGSGKTVAYLLPIINLLRYRIVDDEPFRKPLAIVIVPSYELANQVNLIILVYY